MVAAQQGFMRDNCDLGGSSRLGLDAAYKERM